MMHTNMKLERLAEIVAAYGAAPHRWPAAERQAAEALVLHSAQAAVMVKRARVLDAALDASPDAPVPAALVSRIMAARPRPIMDSIAAMNASASQVSGSLWRSLVQTIWPYGSPAFPAGALVASVVLGIGLGMSAPSALSALGLPATTTVAVNATTSAAGEQLVALALAENEYPEEWKK